MRTLGDHPTPSAADAGEGGRLLTPTQAAVAAGVPRQRIYWWIKTGRLSAFRLGAKRLRIASADLERARTEAPRRPPRPRTEVTRRTSPPRPRTEPPPRGASTQPPRQRAAAEDVTAWVDDFFRRYGRIPPRDEIWRAFPGMTKPDAERYLQDARRRLWSTEP
ncbi:hypothetical protein GCM10028787_32800 [Brachybacterium horti]